MTQEEHRHKMKTRAVQPFCGAVTDLQNAAAHGNVCEVDVCGCGAVRRTNRNGVHVERGLWRLHPRTVTVLHDGEAPCVVTLAQLQADNRGNPVVSAALAELEAGATHVFVGGGATPVVCIIAGELPRKDV